jgi:hypothetical protein
MLVPFAIFDTFFGDETSFEGDKLLIDSLHALNSLQEPLFGEAGQ